jgi:hypothetical protein
MSEHETYLASEVGGTTLRELEDDGALLVTRGLERSHDGGGGGHVLRIGQSVVLIIGWRRLGTHNSRDGILVGLGVLEETEDVITDDDAGLAGELFEDTHCED